MKSEFFKNFIIFLASSTLTLFVVESGLRLFWENPYTGSSAANVVELRLQSPSTNRVLDRTIINPKNPKVVFRTDSRGYIMPSSQYKKPDFNIFFLGGSTTECSYVSEKLRFPALVSTYLTKYKLKVNTFNAAKSGNTLHDSINNLINYIVLDKPDYAIVMHATNDIGVLRNDPTYSTRMGHRVSFVSMGKWLLQKLSGNLELVGFIRHVITCYKNKAAINVGMGKNKPVYIPNLDTSTKNEFVARVNIFVNSSRSLGIVPVIMTQPLANTHTHT